MALEREEEERSAPLPPLPGPSQPGREMLLEEGKGALGGGGCRWVMSPLGRLAMKFAMGQGEAVPLSTLVKLVSGGSCGGGQIPNLLTLEVPVG